MIRKPRTDEINSPDGLYKFLCDLVDEVNASKPPVPVIQPEKKTKSKSKEKKK